MPYWGISFMVDSRNDGSKIGSFGGLCFKSQSDSNKFEGIGEQHRRQS